MTGLTTPRVAPSNTEQARAWDGDEGAYWAAHPETFEQSLARYVPPLLDAAGLHPSSQVLDVGCGTGDTARAAGRLAVAGTVLGVDLSARMIEVARERARRDGLAHVRYEQADAQIHPFAAASVDRVVSKTGTMFFGDPVTAFRNIAHALRPGGRLTMVVWQEPARNEWILAILGALAAGRDLPAPPPDAPGPFSLSDRDRIRDVLEGAGLTDVTAESIERPMYFGPSGDAAYEFVAGLMAWMLRGLDEQAQARALGDLRTAMDAHETPQGVLFGSSAWLVTARR